MEDKAWQLKIAEGDERCSACRHFYDVDRCGYGLCSQYNRNPTFKDYVCSKFRQWKENKH